MADQKYGKVNYLLWMSVHLNVKDYRRCSHSERMIMEPSDATMVAVPAGVRQVQRKKELVTA